VNRLYKAPGHGSRAAHALKNVERDTLGGQYRPGRAGNGRKWLARSDDLAIVGVGFPDNMRIQQRKSPAADRDTGEDAVLLGDHDRTGFSVIRNRGERRDITRADIFGQGRVKDGFVLKWQQLHITSLPAETVSD
jgi:hypothetical protein